MANDTTLDLSHWKKLDISTSVSVDSYIPSAQVANFGLG